MWPFAVFGVAIWLLFTYKILTLHLKIRLVPFRAVGHHLGWHGSACESGWQKLKKVWANESQRSLLLGGFWRCIFLSCLQRMLWTWAGGCCYWLLLHRLMENEASQRESQRKPDWSRAKEDGGMRKERAGVGGEERGNSWPSLENSEFKKDGGTEIWTRHSHGRSHRLALENDKCSHTNTRELEQSFLVKPKAPLPHAPKLHIDDKISAPPFSPPAPYLSILCYLY